MTKLNLLTVRLRHTFTSITATFALCSLGANAATPVDFQRDIQPILTEHCHQCHGPTKRQAGLRLTSRTTALQPTDSGEPAINLTHPDKSLLLERITSTDPKHRMPKEADALSPQQIDTLQRWITEGAIWPDDGSEQKHWAHIKPQRPELPTVSNRKWTRNAIDHFILAKLNERDLTPASSAQKTILLRRVSLALIGLPPSPQEVDAFIADQSPNAYEKVVDRLLASPRYGEHWAHQWLDLARYADSNGFQADQLRDSWAYRDWVINAFNQSMPFDQFTIEQIAGDLLPNATLDQKIATGFHRTVTCNVEAGVHPEENRTNQIFDRVNTTATVWLGSTFECAQCHNHKYDPFTVNDYYQLFAYFNNTPLEVKLTSGVSYEFAGPSIPLPYSNEQKTKRATLQTQLAAAKAKLKTATAQAANAQQVWETQAIQSLGTAAIWHTLAVSDFKTTGGEDHRTLDDQSVLVTGSLPGTTVYTLTANTELTNINGFKIEALTHPDLPGTGPGRGDVDRANFILSEFSVNVNNQRKPIDLHTPLADYSQKGWEVAKAIDGNQKTGWAIGQQFKKDHYATFYTTNPLAAPKNKPLQLKFTLDQNYGRGRTIGRVRISALTGDPQLNDMPKNIANILKKKKRSKAESKKLTDFYTSTMPSLAKLKTQAQTITKRLDAVAAPTTLVMVEMDEPRPTHILSRGNYLSPGKAVTIGTPKALHPLRKGAPNNRLGLAQWLVDENNPLVGRVTVNRWWGQLMGHGLVTSFEDFGTQADLPTHPKLLDWLAVEFVQSGWSMKHIHKLIVMSAAFQQDARVRDPSHLEKDPANIWYARGPRFRMSAELIRDNALAASGLLSTKMAGPPVMPYQPPGMWRQVGRNEPKWVDAQNEDRYRRGVYVIWRRAAPYPSFVNFDAQDRAACVVKRGRTNTPLQALTLLNDPAYVEMALALARRIANDHTAMSTEQRINYGFQLVLARKPKPSEAAHLHNVYQDELQRFKLNPSAAQQIIDNAPLLKPVNPNQAAQLGAWFHISNILLNLDETITRG